MSSTNSVTYNASSQDTFSVPFDFLRAEDLKVYVLGVETPFTLSGTDVVLDSPATGEVIIQRETAVDEPYAVFTDDSAWLADNINASIEQVLWAVQDAHFRIDNIQVPSGGGGDGGDYTGPDIPHPTAADRLLVSKAASGGGWEYQLQTVAQLQTLLGISTPVTVPTPTADGVNYQFPLVLPSSDGYTLRTGAQVLTLLGLTSPALGITAVNGRNNYFLLTNGSTGFNYKSPSEVRAALSLGAASLLGVGTSVGNVVQLISHGSGPALPAVRGDNLLGVAKEVDFAQYSITSTRTVASVASGTFATTTDSGFAADYTTVGSGSWNSLTSAGVTLATGTYVIRAEFALPASSNASDAKIEALSGTVSPSTSASVINGTDLSNAGSYVIEGVFKVTSANAEIAFQLKRGAALTGSVILSKLRMMIQKTS